MRTYHTVCGVAADQLQERAVDFFRSAWSRAAASSFSLNATASSLSRATQASSCSHVVQLLILSGVVSGSLLAEIGRRVRRESKDLDCRFVYVTSFTGRLAATKKKKKVLNAYPRSRWRACHCKTFRSASGGESLCRRGGQLALTRVREEVVVVADVDGRVAEDDDTPTSPANT
ncbi:hypothetical protein BHM03_00008710 [Ensete ventricosum]|nr:hypothetical protein BHM03_00008710 [Ensete ventricosum]